MEEEGEAESVVLLCLVSSSVMSVSVWSDDGVAAAASSVVVDGAENGAGESVLLRSMLISSCSFASTGRESLPFDWRWGEVR